MTQTTFQYDVIIVGAGMVGAAFACALGQATNLSIALIDAKTIHPRWSAEHYDLRVSAIAPGAQRFLQQLQVWPHIVAKRTSPFCHMHVWDAATKGAIQFNSRELGQLTLGHIIENNVIQASLIERLQTLPSVQLMSNVQLSGWQECANHIELQTSDHATLQAKLLIAADGTHSWIRQRAGIAVQQEPAVQTAIVTTVQTELPHQQTAWQRFLPTGPLAFLPLADAHLSSIVWSLPEASAQSLLSLNDEAFLQALGQAFDYRLGKILQAQPRKHFTLQRHLARQYVKPHLALIGDAAHTIHPLAGQGVNLGLQDAECLSRLIVEALQKKRDYTSLATLRRYERERKCHNTAMHKSLELIHSLFTSENTALQGLRALGLNATQRLQHLKNFFAQYAMG